MSVSSAVVETKISQLGREATIEYTFNRGRELNFPFPSRQVRNEPVIKTKKIS